MAYVIYSVVYEYVCNLGAELYFDNWFLGTSSFTIITVKSHLGSWHNIGNKVNPKKGLIANKINL